MSLQESFGHTVEQVCHWVTDSEKFIAEEAEAVEEGTKDFIAGLHSSSMPPTQRRLDEFKIAAGVAALSAGVAELGPFALCLSSPAAVVPAVEGIKEIIDYGHKDRVRAQQQQAAPPPP